jgi:hypothetical protein
MRPRQGHGAVEHGIEDRGVGVGIVSIPGVLRMMPPSPTCARLGVVFGTLDATKSLKGRPRTDRHRCCSGRGAAPCIS